MQSLHSDDSSTIILFYVVDASTNKKCRGGIQGIVQPHKNVNNVSEAVNAGVAVAQRKRGIG